MEDAHAKTVEEIQNFFNVDPEKGLSIDQIKRNQAKYGPNGTYNSHRLKVYCEFIIKVKIRNYTKVSSF